MFFPRGSGFSLLPYPQCPYPPTRHTSTQPESRKIWVLLLPRFQPVKPPSMETTSDLPGHQPHSLPPYRGLAFSLLPLRTKAALLPSLSDALRGPRQTGNFPGNAGGVAPGLDPRALVSIPTSDLGVSGRHQLRPRKLLCSFSLRLSCPASAICPGTCPRPWVH